MTLEKGILHMRKLLKNSTNPILFFDSDADGGTSYLQLKKAFSRLIGFPITKSEDSQRACLERVEEKHDLVIFFDTPHIFEFFFEKIQNKKSIWVDHHTNNRIDLAKKYNVFHFNPLNFDETDSRPSCFWAYKVANLKENLPYVVLGTISDFYLLDIIEDFSKNNKILFSRFFNISQEKKEELLKFIKKNKFNDEKTQEERANWIQFLSYETNVGVYKFLFDFIYKLEKYDQTLGAVNIIRKTPLTNLLEYVSAGKEFPYQEFNTFFTKGKKLVKKAVSENKENEFVYFEHKGKVSYNRQISEEVAFKLKSSKIIMSVFYKKDSEYVSCSFRARQGYTIHDIISKSLENLSGQGGGHPQAGGALVMNKDFDKFKKRFKTLAMKKIKS